MVILVFKGARSAASRQRTVLRQIFKDADYQTENLSAGVGTEHGEARNLIRLIKGVTIGAEKYPLSQNARYKDRNLDLDVWGNEGASARRSPED